MYIILSMMLYNTVVTHIRTQVKKSQCNCTWFGLLSMSGKVQQFGKDATYARQPTTTNNAPPPQQKQRGTIYKKTKCANHYLVVRSQPWGGLGRDLLRKKWRPLRTCLGMRTALRHPWVSWFSGLNIWSWGTPVLAVLLSCFLFFCCRFFSLTIVITHYLLYWLAINMAVHSLQQRGTGLTTMVKKWTTWLFCILILYGSIHVVSLMFGPP